MVKKRKHSQVLQDHFKKGNTFYPPFTCEDGIGRFEQIKWRADFVPELIWIGLFIKDYGYDRAKEIVSDIAFFAKQSQLFDTHRDFGIISSYKNLSEDAKKRILNKLNAHCNVDEIENSLSHLIFLYPECPLSFLLSNPESKTDHEKAISSVGPVLEEMLYRLEKLPTFVQGIHYDVEISSGKLKFVPPLKPKDTSLLKDYPDTKESEMVASAIRASTQMISMSLTSNAWPKYFWSRGYEIGDCEVAPSDELFIGNIRQEVILYHQECFYRYSERANNLWETIDENYKIDLYNPLKDEILLALACRVYRLAIHVVSFIPNWTEDISEIYVRMVCESYFYYRWLKQKGKQEDFEKFYEYGLGQQKLRFEHLNQYFRSQGISEKEIKEHSYGFKYLNSHKMPQFVPVNIGNPLGKNLRIIAEEADCRETYVMMYSPASSAVHGMYDSLDLFYSKRCINPFHCFHKIPYHWSKCPVTTYAVFNCLSIADWLIADLLSDLNKPLPEDMPGDLFIKELLSKEGLEEFSKKSEVQEWIKHTESMRNMKQKA
jgi:hypothetical protein